ncbi:DJ-1/PfpI family protein [Furfurilactobacillus milii]|uniref:DJ-1/PfpI family protein n=1 Tax=Furfurilactobacillus milii TaxID=2888272 RepID=A0ABT6D9Z4_9LACO|nr:DJ-1/PfpI family protein [Furfurilactobacillus milii]QLE67215.1 4-methyl-5B-hydroxyethyl-thiazole monophosphate biosynthesis enzyme amidase [Furfurilactobacillus rossiae]MCF6161089.1 DJ-1/PfpI family protein [Furfurilactobacillus milii]MCF6163421.1 DJ-1/PfpI family protein [Furfurilactobacillus milii]MCF6418777.1 DJ-1/PfpI family protein [Furfurilactobacillus milii]MDF9913622.1 DJ-1/PfpI family protein [Furfurilactobacillus milii]
MNKILVMIYDGFSMYEISALTSIFAWSPLSNWKIDVVAAKRKIYQTEDGFAVMPQRTFDEVDNIQEYKMLILPGIADYHVVLPDKRNIEFLKRFKIRSRPIIAAISASPILLAKAGLLEDTHFTAGLFESAYVENSFIPKKNLLRKPVVSDNGIVTSSAYFVREFAIVAAHELGINVPDNFFEPLGMDTTEESLVFHDSNH